MAPESEQDAVGTLKRPFNPMTGYMSAKIWIIAPALAALAIMFVFGEGDYIVPVLGILWFGISIYGWRLWRTAPAKSHVSARGFRIAFWSSILSLICLVLTTSLLLEGLLP